MYKGFRSSFPSFLRPFVSSFIRSFVQTVWFRALRPDTIDSVVFGRIVDVFFVRRDFRLLPILSPRDVYRSAAAPEVGRIDEATGL